MHHLNTLVFVTFDRYLVEACSFLMRERKAVNMKGKEGREEEAIVVTFSIQSQC